MARTEPSRAHPRTQSGAAISADGKDWFLLNASPDLLTQIQRFPPLAPQPQSVRNSPIEGVLLTNADLDHVLGLTLLREGGPLIVYSSPRVREALTDGLQILPLLERYSGVTWQPHNLAEEPLRGRSGKPSDLTMRAFDIPGSAPKYHRTETRRAPGDSVGYVLKDMRTGGTLVFAPDVSEIAPQHLQFYEAANVLLLDGTFWSENEMEQAGTGTARAADMGHLPISGARGSLALLERLPARHRVYMHINNTNPILLEDSAERIHLNQRGIIAGEDGMEFEI